MRPSRDVLLAVCLGAAFLLIYALTACPTFFGGDSAELAAAAATLGVPHPPGYPTYTVTTAGIGWLFALFANDFAHAANLASGLYAATTLALGYLLLRRLSCGIVGALVAGIGFGCGRTFWSQATVSEVYTFDLLLGAAAALVLRISSEGRGWRGPLAAGLLIGLWGGHRTVNILYLPALLALLPAGGTVSYLRDHWKALLSGMVLATLVFLYLPLASRHEPYVDIGDPSTLDRFLVVVSGSPYMRHLTGGGWQLGRFFSGLWYELGPLVVLALLGLWACWQDSRRRLAVGAMVVLVAGLAFASRYRILDVEVYFLPASAALAALAAFGGDTVFQACEARGVLPARIVGTVLIAAAAIGLFQNHAACDLSWNHLARRAAEDVLQPLEQNAVLLAQGDTTIHGLWYLQAVEGRRSDVIVVSLGHLWPWYVEQLQRRFPEEPWPAFEGKGSPLPPTYARKLLDALEPRRPVYATLSVDTSRLVGRDATGKSYRVFPRGMTSRILPRGRMVDLAAESRQDHEFLRNAVARLGEIPHEIDMDSKSTLLQYALALSQDAALLERLGDRSAAREAWRLVLALDPDRHEGDVAEDVWRGLRQRIPRMEIGRRAAKALKRLGDR